jgi:structural maintenance of chromosome 1
MSSRIQELESSVTVLEDDLKRVQNKEGEAKLAAEKAAEEINQLKDEAKGIL